MVNLPVFYRLPIALLVRTQGIFIIFEKYAVPPHVTLPSAEAKGSAMQGVTKPKRATTGRAPIVIFEKKEV